jgi:hypothetical protein
VVGDCVVVVGTVTLEVGELVVLVLGVVLDDAALANAAPPPASAPTTTMAAIALGIRVVTSFLLFGVAGDYGDELSERCKTGLRRLDGRRPAPTREAEREHDLEGAATGGDPSQLPSPGGSFPSPCSRPPHPCAEPPTLKPLPSWRGREV